MITMRLRLTANTMRPAVWEGRVFRTDITVAPGISKSVTTPGNGASGECMSKSKNDVATAAASQSVVRRGQRGFSVDELSTNCRPFCLILERILRRRQGRQQKR